ncbi:unnamed protein product, partial [Mesorhabditis belari]|uniref:Spondin-1 n=1 Tax=Mesorhabditis belari TaxID=2138241 RepID=A0AAF3ETX8_9BILA
MRWLWPLLVAIAFADECTRRPYEAKGDKRSGNNGYVIEVNGMTENANKTEGLVPGETYVVTIRGWRTEFTAQTFRGFVLTAHTEQEKPAGGFETPMGKSDVRQAPGCRNAGVSHANLRPKTEVSVKWRAPEMSSGCVLFRASVIESKYIWYSDESQLTKKLCLQDGYQKVVPVDEVTAECCACDQAKYQLEFIGLWSKETHPKDFPTLEHLTHFTDMLGASHSSNYSLWKFGEISSDGMKEIAEWGNTYQAEKEAKEKASEVRTLMKLKGLWYPEVQGRTNTTFITNKYHHFASLATMFGPSPDWCVGLSSINLCLPDCTWVPERSFDLQPWDAGTDDGPTYMSPNSPAEPRHRIVAITTKTDPRNPFYDASTDVIPPLARIVIKRIEVTPSSCRKDEDYKREAFNATNTSEDDVYKDRRECMMSEWEPWSLCSATCGKGIRMRSRVFRFPVKAQMFNCHRQTTERQFCNAKINECADSELFNSKCAVGSWQGWTECSETCGHGIRTRKRAYIDSSTNHEECKVELEKQEICVGEHGEDCSVTPDPLCRTTSWSDWSPCSASCDQGVKVRTRLFFYAEHEARCSNIKLMEKENCVLQSCKRLIEAHSEEICAQPKEEGQCKGAFPRYWFNSENKRCERFIYSGCKGNENQFNTEDECRRACIPGYEVHRAHVPNHQLVNEFGGEEINDGGEKVNCEMTEWSPWGACSATCGRGKRTRSRNVKIFPRNGGISCPEHIIQEHTCHLRPCLQSYPNALIYNSK